MKKVNIPIILSLMILLLLQACNNTRTQDTSKATLKADENTSEIIGKSATLEFSKFKVIETFVSDSTLHWKHIDNDGTVTEADEHVSYKKLNDNQFFINWIEKTGLTVSQILDTKAGIATAYVSRADEKSQRGKRAATFFEGSFKLNK